MKSLMQKLIYAINICLTLFLARVFEQDHLLNVINLGVYEKEWMCTYLKRKTVVAQSLIYDFFSNFDCQKAFP